MTDIPEGSMLVPAPSETFSDEPALYIVATPLGNLADITIRAIFILEQVDLIYCEDTRKSGILLNHYSIKTARKSYRVHQLEQDTNHAIEQLEQGKRIALISDAGTPGLSDPGSHLVRFVREKLPQVKILAIPGPSALASAVSVSGWQSNPTHFIGFLPIKPGKRKRMLESCAELTGICVFYESVHRAHRLIEELRTIFPSRDVLVLREISKLFEQSVMLGSDFSDCKWKEAVSGIRKKGEFTIMLAPKK